MQPYDGEEDTLSDDEAVCLEWIKRRIVLSEFSDDQWKSVHTRSVQEFVSGEAVRRLFIFLDKVVGLCVQFTLPSDPSVEFMYFIRSIGDTVVTPDNVSVLIQYGKVSGSSLDSLYRVMTGVYVPLFLESSTCKGLNRREFAGQLQKFMASLTEMAHRLKGMTVLYVPNEDLSNSDKAAEDKELLQRLDSALIHWTRQIKEIIGGNDISEHAESVGPLAEIQFWKLRTENLSSIRVQLARSDVKKIVIVLERAKSAYLGPFHKLADLIENGSLEAQDNLKFLTELLPACIELANAEPKQIPDILQSLLNTIRMIWALSQFYNTPERLTGLLSKVSNEIINRCCAKISLKDIFQGDAVASIIVLKESIIAGEAWKTAYRATASNIATRSGQKRWEFEESSIFAQIDAFVQRCRDLLEVCEAQIQFTRKNTEGQKDPVPVFPGTRGVEIVRSLEQIEQSFERLLGILSQVDYNILDVKTTRWHDDYNNFKQGVKDLEVMLQNVITLAFDTVSTVVVSVQLLRIFGKMAIREAVKRTVIKKASEVYHLFMEDINFVRRKFDMYKRSPPGLKSLPPFAAAGFWARGYVRRVEEQWALLDKAEDFLVLTKEKEEASIAYHQLINALQSYISTTYTEWENQIPDDFEERLHTPLLVRSDDNLLESNLDKQLISTFAEAIAWPELQNEIPEKIKPLLEQAEQIRVLKENVLLVVHDYNSILGALSEDGRGLFNERILNLDEVIKPGLESLLWKDDSDKILEFIKESQKECRRVTGMVSSFRENRSHIDVMCQKIRETLLVDVGKKTVYTKQMFEESQERHRAYIKKKLQEIHKEIADTLSKSFETFEKADEDVRIEWTQFVQSVDKTVEDMLRQTVKKSLQQLERSINGVDRSETEPIFTVNVVLEKPQKATFMSKPQMFFRPSLDELIHLVTSVCSELFAVVSVVPRLTEDLEAKMEFGKFSNSKSSHQVKSFYNVIKNDDDILKIVANITNGMSNNKERMQKYIEMFGNSYKEVWDIDKDAFIRRYMRTHADMDQYMNIDSDINRYRIQQQLIQNEETITVINFVQVDCSPLKNSLIAHCNEWMNKFTALLNNVAKKELFDLHNMFETNTITLKKPPASLWEMGDSLSLLKSLQEQTDSIEQRFEPLKVHYRTLEKWEAQVTAEEETKLKELPNAWESFGLVLRETEGALESYKERFKSELLASQETFFKNVTSMREEFKIRAPFDPVLSTERSFEIIGEFKEDLSELKVKELDIQKGLAIFNLESPLVKELPATQKDLDLLEKVWKLTDDWNKKWEQWKSSQFLQIDGDELENQAAQFFKRIVRLREIKTWDIWPALKDRIDQFRRTLPLIQDLKNKSMRERHWEALMEEVGKTFDPNSDTFTLEFVLELGLDQYAEAVSALSVSATQELAIEETLKQLKATWLGTSLDIVDYKNGFYRLRSADDVFQMLDDNQATLSALKNSPYFHAFEDQVEHWEKILSLILETVEMTITVQRHWMYLENIFTGSADIRKQLPTETVVFENVNANWKHIMGQLATQKNVLKGATVSGIVDTLNEMNHKLEKIQKSLDQFLETKRRAFARFYFISNDDLLEILGQAKDPNSVQTHLKKCFENVKSLSLAPPGKDGRRTWEALEMISSEGEQVKFAQPVMIDGPVEMWLSRVVTSMQKSIQKLIIDCLMAHKRTSRSKLVRDWAGQLLITCGQIIWTNDCTRALGDIEKGDKNALKVLRKQQNILLSRLAQMVQGPLTNVQRLKINALLTIEVHARDVIERLITAKCSSPNEFEWLSQLRFYWDKDEEDCVVRQTNTLSKYGYEYLGNTGRLVITPLTDRCYMTLTTAMHLKLGGAPQGPAGTGKTETVKDLGKALAKFVLVFNCSEGLDYQSLGRMFSGLAQTGAWSCFDEFNRIEVEVLSVVAQQIACILTAIMNNMPRFIFEGSEINLIQGCAFFVTMNPGYAGRSELPDNLKSLFRPVSMMVPDATLIAEIMLFSEGFPVEKSRSLAKKVVTLYGLSIQQLSKQDHYDFGLRAIKSVLIAAGALKRSEPDWSEELVLLRAMRNMNVPKMVDGDLDLFVEIMGDLFPGVETPVPETDALQGAIETELAEAGLQVHAGMVQKTIQLNDTKNTRHGVMIIGSPGSGKTVCWNNLQKAFCRLKKSGVEGYQIVRSYVINPKALTLGELFGDYDTNTREWTDGILSNVMRQVCQDEKDDLKWLVLDGPVDTTWIESLNTVLDDNKMLTLVNGERVSLTAQVSLLFEVSDLSQASPATISRAGMVYLDQKSLGWKPFVQTWLAKREDKIEVEHLEKLFQRHVQGMLDFKKNNCVEPVPVSDISAVVSLCNLYGALATSENGVIASDVDFYQRMIEMWFTFCIVWSLGGSVDTEGRSKIDMYLREFEGQFPTKDTVYEYYVDAKKRTWTHWSEKLPQQWRYHADTPFHKILVPTVGTIRTSFLLQALVKSRRHTLLTGTTGVGKTALIQNTLSSMEADQYASLTLNFSSRTSSDRTQKMIDSAVEKRTKEVYVPVGGKKLVVFVDDLNMPAKDQYGSQPPLELLRQWVDYGFWYDKQKQTPKYIQGMQLLCAMGHPGGGRQVISERLQNRFNLINITFPDNDQIQLILETLITQKLNDFEEEIKPLAPSMVKATLDLYQNVTKNLLPTPNKSHYLFSLRDLFKVFQGLMCADKNFYDTRDALIRLWAHECMRIFNDRLVDDQDRAWFIKAMDEKLLTYFSSGWKQLIRNGNYPIFGDFMREGMETAVYEEIVDMSSLKATLEESLEDYNAEPKLVPMDLVLFKYAMEHICRIHRIVRMSRGNALLVGVGGSGRQSLARLAAYVTGFEVFQVEITRQYRLIEFHEDLKKLYWQAGIDKKPTVFLFSDTQIMEEAFLEDINNILSSGEVPNLYTTDELVQIRDSVRTEAISQYIADNPNALFNYFIERVRSNVHVVLCMSPVGSAFRNRVRMYPALVSCTTLDWFTEWPSSALGEVAMKFLEGVEVEDPVLKEQMASFFVTAHTSVVAKNETMFKELGRRNYVTPTNYLELVSGYRELVKQKREEFTDAANKLRSGLTTLDDTRQQVQKLSKELVDKKMLAAKSQKECEDLLVVIVQERRIAEEHARQVSVESEKLETEETEIEKQREEAQSELDVAMPALEAATKALETLTKKDIAEIRAYVKPPPLVEYVMTGVLIVTKKEPTWSSAKREMNDSNFLNNLVKFDKDNISDTVLKKVERIITDPQFKPEIVGKVSVAAKGLCMWVRAIHSYGTVFREVKPKKDKLKSAVDSLARKRAALKLAKERLQEITDKVITLKAQYDESVATKERLRRESEETEIRLSRAEKLISGLASERVRWEGSIVEHELSRVNCVGDCLTAAAFLSYCGPFPSDYRQELVEQVFLRTVKELKIPCFPDFQFSSFLGKATEIRDWQIQGLPTDSFSMENGILATRGRRWALMIDPQGQARTWVMNMESEKGLAIVDLKMPDFLRTIENAIKFGSPVLIQDLEETVDPSLEPILSKAIIKQGSRFIIRFCDKEIDYDPRFRLYLTTKRSNPHYPPEVSTKTTMVNFTVKEQGLEEQLLGIVIKKERPELEEQKNQLVLSMANANKKLTELEDDILRLLSSATGSLLEDEVLVTTLQSAKTTSEEIKQQLVISEQTEAKIDQAREAYRVVAKRASILYFVLSDLGHIDPMYQFSLDSYIELFLMSMQNSPKSEDLNERIRSIIDYHTYSFYCHTCRGLFEVHKLLFSFQMCVRILQEQKKIKMEEYGFFLRGGTVLDKESQQRNPCHEWLGESNWDNITELDKLNTFNGIAQSFDGQEMDWKAWYFSSEPENTPFPGEWENKLTELQRMIAVRCLRPDRVLKCVTHFITTQPELGPKFVEPPVFNLEKAFEDSTPLSPFVFVLSPGVDPKSMLVQLAEKHGKNVRTLALGQGQAPIAHRLIEEGSKTGDWVFLANCHLMISWMPRMEKIISELSKLNPHSEFRLWLSSNPHPSFPISVLQRSVKLTTEPPRGIKANLLRLYGLLSNDRFSRCQSQEKYKKLLFSLCFYHSVLLERRKFLSLGWNIPYDFNDSDFDVSENVISMYLDEYDKTPWEAIRYLIAEVNYGGRVTEELDRRLLRDYAKMFFCNDALDAGYQLSELATYFIPEDGPLGSYTEYISTLRPEDRPEAFGQHQNADIASQIRQADILLDSLLKMSPKAGFSSGSSGASVRTVEEVVFSITQDMLDRLPQSINSEEANRVYTLNPGPLSMVCVHEIERYNGLLKVLRESLSLLQKGIKGQVVMSSKMEEIFRALKDGKVPEAWQKVFPSLKPLGPWTRELTSRVDQFRKWSETGNPPVVFWMGGFSFPTGFLTAILQTSARQLNVPIDQLSWEFTPVPTPEIEITQRPKEGVYIKGLWLEGASWNHATQTLDEAGPMELVSEMPVMHFKPVEAKKKSQKGVYQCPCYVYPVRVGTRDKPSYVLSVDLKSGNYPAEKWTKRGTALLLTLAD